MAAVAACPTLHDFEGECNYCGKGCNSTQDVLNALSCSFEGCPPFVIYHQHCIETYLKSLRLDKQRKAGFQCPRGCGRGSKSAKPCPGRITKSHPIFSRSDSSKKRRKVKTPETVPIPVPQDNSKKPPLLVKSSAVKERNEGLDTEQKRAPAVLSPSGPSVLHRASSIPSERAIGGGSSINSTSDNTLKRVCSTNIAAITAVAAVQLDAQTVKGRVLKSGLPTIGFEKLEKSYAEMASEVPFSESLASDGNSFARPATCQDVGSSSAKSVNVLPIVNAWTTGRSLAAVLLHGQMDNRLNSVSYPPLSREGSEPVSDIFESQAQSSPVAKASTISVVSGEDDDIEARSRRARTKNERKHLQRAAAKIRAKREIEQAGVINASAALEVVSNKERDHVFTSESSHACLSNTSDVCGNLSIKPWNQSTVQALRGRKSLLLAKQLEGFGFVSWQAIMAVQVCGNDMHACIDWLLRNGAGITADMPPLQSQGVVDVSEDLIRLEEIFQMETFTQDEVELSVLKHNGDIDAAFGYLSSLRQCSKQALAEERCESFQLGGGNSLDDTNIGRQHVSVRSLSSVSWESFQNQMDSSWDSSASVTLSSSVKSSDSENSYAPFSGRFVSDVAHYNTIAGIHDTHISPQSLNESSAFFAVGSPCQRVHAPSFFQAGHRFAPIGQILDGLNDCALHEPPVSTVTSIAAAVRNEKVVADERCITSLIEAIHDDSPVMDTVNPPNSGDIWRFPSSTGFPKNRSLGIPPGFCSIPSSKRFETNRLSESIMRSNFSHSKDAQMEWPGCKGGKSEQSRTAIDDAKEQDKLLSQLLSQLLN